MQHSQCIAIRHHIRDVIIDTMVQTFNINVKSLSYGIEEIILSFDEQEIPFIASYIGSEPISSLIDSLIYLEEEIENMDKTRYFDKWLDEPGILDFEMYKDKHRDYILIKITYDNCASEFYKKKSEWQFEMPYSLYRQTILKTALKMLNDFGLNGFNDSWSSGKDTFPLCSLISLLGAKSTYLQEQGTSHSNIFEELKLLTDNINNNRNT